MRYCAKIVPVLTDLTCTTTADICLKRSGFLETAFIIRQLQSNSTVEQPGTGKIPKNIFAR